MRRPLCLFIASLAGLACAGKSDDPPPLVYPADPAAGLPECVVPGSMVPQDVSGAWSIGRTLLVCTAPGLQGECFSDDGGSTCPQFAAGTDTCVSACTATQYAVGYSNSPLTEGPAPPLISSCTGGGLVSYGGATYCCPCQ